MASILKQLVVPKAKSTSSMQESSHPDLDSDPQPRAEVDTDPDSFDSLAAPAPSPSPEAEYDKLLVSTKKLLSCSAIGKDLFNQ